MKNLATIILCSLLNFGTVQAVLAGPGGYTLPKYLERANAPTPEWAKAHPRLTTAQTPNVAHSCNKDLHTRHCVKRCVKRSAHVQRKRSVQATVIKQTNSSH